MDISAAVETFISKGIFSLFLPFSFANLDFFFFFLNLANLKS